MLVVAWKFCKKCIFEWSIKLKKVKMGEILFTVMFFVIVLLLIDRKDTHDDIKDQKLKDEDPLGYRTRERLKEKLRQTTLNRWNQDTEEDFNLSKQHQQNVEKTEPLDDIRIHNIKKDDGKTPMW
jgi:hypothetical protein